MMETYADLLKREKEKVEKNMTNYDMDEMRRRQERQADYDGCLGQTERKSDAESEAEEARKKFEITDGVDFSKRAEFAQDIIDSEKTTNIEIEIPDQELLHLAKAAHDRDITLNQLCIDILKSAFDDLDYRFEHSSKPVVLKEY